MAAPQLEVTDAEIGSAEGWQLSWAARLHVEELEVGLFPALGEGFMERYHRAAFESPHSTYLVARAGPDPIGFAIGFLSTPAHLRWVLRNHSAALAIEAFKAFVRHPELLERFIRTRLLRYARASLCLFKRQCRDARTDLAPHGTLMHIAVDRQARGRGVGAALAESIAAELGRQGARSIQTRTSTADRFYRQLGWLEIGGGVDVDGHEFRCFAVGGAVLDPIHAPPSVPRHPRRYRHA